MIRPLPVVRCWIALALAPALLAQTGFQPRLDAAAAVMDRFYRGESPEAGQQRVNALVERYNGLVQQRNTELQAARDQADRELAPSNALAADLDAQDRALGAPPDPSDPQAVRRYNERVRARNALAARVNQSRAAAQPALDRYNQLTRRLDAGIDQARARLEAERQAFKARADALDAFHDQGRDLAFFAGLNQLLADLRAACRSRPDPGLLAALAQVRGWRRELARWAGARQAAQDNGLVLVQAMVGDEPCCFIVDTGAQLVCLPTELISALGLSGSLGESATLTLAGGQKLRGRSIVLPRVAVGGQVGTEVAGSAVPASEVGIDGLLGQSFLKHFVYTIDEGRPGKLLLVPRPQGNPHPEPQLD
jgi:clan AA aspartic protease (TIGR02281 family)